MKNQFRYFRLLVIAAIAVAAPGCGRPSASFDPAPFVRGENVINFNSLEEDAKVSRISHGYSNKGMFRSV